MNVNEKQCSRCKRILPLGDFSPDRRTHLGVGSQCKACNRDRMKGYTARTRKQRSAYNRRYRQQHRDRLDAENRRWREQNRETISAKRKAKYAANPAPMLAYQIEYRRNNLDMIRRRQREYSKTRIPEIMARNAEWRKQNPEKFKAQAKRRRALKLGAGEATLTAEQWQQIIKAYNGRRAYCGKRPKKLTQDHRVALSRGGSHTASNVVPACLHCNCKKWANPRTPIIKPKELTNA